MRSRKKSLQIRRLRADERLGRIETVSTSRAISRACMAQATILELVFIQLGLATA